MPQLLGDYECKVDSKGRMRMPSQLMKKLGSEDPCVLVVNRGMEGCLSLYPKEVWDRLVEKVNTLNTYVKKNRLFVRQFYSGATEIVVDGNDRILLPKRLTEWADIGSEVVVFGMNNWIELWQPEKYEATMADQSEDFSDLGEQVMGSLDFDSE